jgi:hypothetical protein
MGKGQRERRATGLARGGARRVPLMEECGVPDVRAPRLGVDERRREHVAPMSVKLFCDELRDNVDVDFGIKEKALGIFCRYATAWEHMDKDMLTFFTDNGAAIPPPLGFGIMFPVCIRSARQPTQLLAIMDAIVDRLTTLFSARFSSSHTDTYRAIDKILGAHINDLYRAHEKAAVQL